MLNRLPYWTEWAARTRNELLETRMQLDHLPANERAQHYRDVIDRAVKSLRAQDQRADSAACLQALEEMFPAWLPESGSVPPVPIAPPAVPELTAEELATLLIKQVPNLSPERRAAIGNKLKQAFPIGIPPALPVQTPARPQVAPPPQPLPLSGNSIDEVRKEFGLAAGEPIDPEMVLLLLVAVTEVLNDILKTAGDTWTRLKPTALKFMSRDRIPLRLGPYLTESWKENLGKLQTSFKLEEKKYKQLTVSFETTQLNLGKVLQASVPDRALLIELLRGLVELQLPHPSMVVAMLEGSMLDGPWLFANDKYYLFNYRSIEASVKAIKPGADGRDFWKKYVELVKDYQVGKLSSQVQEALISGMIKGNFCPDALKED